MMPIKVFSVEQMVAAEKAADAAGVGYDQMMETAGRRVAEAIVQRFAIDGRSVLVLVGPGNNGGDGLVAGRYLAEAGADVAFYLYKPRDPQEDANFAKIQQLGLFAVDAQFDQRYRVLRTRLNITDLLIDALLGTGVSRPIGGELARLMQQAQAGLEERRTALAAERQSPLISVAAVPQQPARPLVPVVAVDCPSGLNCDTGELDKLAIPAALTVTFAGPKRGHFMFPGAAACGELVVADIGISPELTPVQEVDVALATADWVRDRLPQRALDGHKGTFGTAVIAAGAARYWGAPVLAARGAYRIGAGLVALAVPQAVRATVATQIPEATYPPVSAVDMFDGASAGEVREAARSAAALLVGPGMDKAEAFLEKLLAQSDELPPLVVDADGLNVLSRWPDWPQRLPSNTILTPHPGEMARLMDVPIDEVKEADRVALAREKANAWGHVVLLKGAYTVVAAPPDEHYPDGRCAILPFANPLMAVGGSGDVLSGVIVGLLAQGLAPYEAAVVGGYVHGAAAELARQANGNAGLLSAELADWLPRARLRLANDDPTQRPAGA